jgi:hypothetical protein
MAPVDDEMSMRVRLWTQAVAPVRIWKSEQRSRATREATCSARPIFAAATDSNTGRIGPRAIVV